LIFKLYDKKFPKKGGNFLQRKRFVDYEMPGQDDTDKEPSKPLDGSKEEDDEDDWNFEFGSKKQKEEPIDIGKAKGKTDHFEDDYEDDFNDDEDDDVEDSTN